MNRKRSLPARLVIWIVLWIILPFVLMAAVLSIWHPEKPILDRLFSRIEKETHVRINYSNLTMASPWAVAFHDVSIALTQPVTVTRDGTAVNVPPRVLFETSRATFSIAWKPFLKGHGGLKFDCLAYQGRIWGTVHAPITGNDASMFLEPYWRDIAIEDLRIHYPEIILERGISAGSGNVTFDPVQQFGTTGWIDIQLRDLDYTLPEQAAGLLSTSAFNLAEGILRLKKRRVDLDNFWVRGDTGSLRVTGSITRDIIPENTGLNLEIRMYSHERDATPSLDQYIPVTLKGTAGNPVLGFLGSEYSFSDNAFEL
jgi:hypothetical protein